MTTISVRCSAHHAPSDLRFFLVLLCVGRGKRERAHIHICIYILGANNADGSSASRGAALAAFRKFVPAKLASDSPAEGVYQSYEIQGVLFIVAGVEHVRRAQACVLIPPTPAGASPDIR